MALTYEYIVHPDGRAGPYGGVLEDAGTALKALQYAIDSCPAGKNILLAPGAFSLNGTPLLKNSSIIGSVKYKTLYLWDGSSMSFVPKYSYAVPASRLVSTVNNINSYILRRNDYTGPITLANIELDGGIGAEDVAQSRALFGGVGLYNSENTIIEGCYIHNVTHTGVYAAHRGNPAKNQGSATVRNCEIANCGLRYNKSYREYGTGVAGGGGGWDSGASSILVENNYIHHCSMSAVNCEPGRNWLVRDNYLGCPWVYGLSESDKNKGPWAITVRPWHGQAASGNVHEHNYVESGTGWGVVYNGEPKNNICRNNVIRHLRGAIVASGGGSLADQTISGNSTSGPLITVPTGTPPAHKPPAAENPVEEPVIEAPASSGAIGVNDQCVIAWILEGKVGQNRLFLGSTKTDPTTAMNASDIKDLARRTMAGLVSLNVPKLRIGAGDRWSSNIMYGTWKNNPTKFYQVLDAYADAARELGVQLTITCLGFADAEYDQERTAIFDPASQEFANAMAYCGDVAKHYGGHAGVELVEITNESDHDLYAFNYWLKLYPDYATRLAKYSAWVKAAYDLTVQLAGEGHAVVGMGHALVGAMFCVDTYHWDSTSSRYVADTWNYSRNNKDYLKVPNDPLPRPTAHFYWFGASTADFTNDWISPFASYCKGRGVRGYVGEHGDLRTGAAWYVKDIEAAMTEAGLDSFAMRLAPRDGFPLSSEPIIDTPAPDEPVVEDPTSSIEPPAQGTTEETTEPPTSEEPGQEPPPPEVVEEPPPVTDESPSVEPEPVTPEIVIEPEPAPGPTPGSGRNVLIEIILRFFSFFKRKKGGN